MLLYFLVRRYPWTMRSRGCVSSHCGRYYGPPIIDSFCDCVLKGKYEPQIITRELQIVVNLGLALSDA